MAELINPKRINLRTFYDEFNARFFDGECLSDVVLRWSSRMRRASGVVRATHSQITGSIRDVRLTLSSAYRYPLAEFPGILLHEMVHVCMLARGLAFEQHGPRFRHKAKEVGARSGIAVPMTHRRAGGEASIPPRRLIVLRSVATGAVALAEPRTVDVVRCWLRSSFVGVEAFWATTQAHLFLPVSRKVDRVIFRLPSERVRAVLTLREEDRIAAHA